MPENCAAIVIAAKHHELSKVKDTRGTTHTVGALRCKFDFRTNDWANAAKTAMFCNGNALLHPEVIKAAISVPLDADNECSVPLDVLTDTLPYSVGVWGITDKGFRIVSRWLVFEAQDGCYAEGSAPSDPEPTVYEQILSISKKAVDAANEVAERANTGEFDGDSAYQIALNHGYEGSESEWLESLAGDNGIGIIKSEINTSGELVLTYSDGKVANVGSVLPPIDDALNDTSTNPVQNKVITGAFNEALEDIASQFVAIAESLPPDAADAHFNDLALVTKDGKWAISEAPVCTKSDLFGFQGRMDYFEERLTGLETTTGEMASSISGARATANTALTTANTAKSSAEAAQLEALKANNAIGDIDAALDSIIAIQQSLIGGDGV